MLNKKGFTLIEAIVAIALTAIIFTGLAYGTATITSLYTESNKIKDYSNTLYHEVQSTSETNSDVTSATGVSITMKIGSSSTTTTLGSTGTLYTAKKNLDDDTTIALKYFVSSGSYVSESSSSGTTTNTGTPPIPTDIPELGHNSGYTHTVYDRMYYLTHDSNGNVSSKHNKGYYVSGTAYSNGDFVYYKPLGYWYLKIYSDSDNEYSMPGTYDSGWQIMEQDYNSNHISSYYTYDMVRYQGSYYYVWITGYLGDNTNSHFTLNPTTKTGNVYKYWDSHIYNFCKNTCYGYYYGNQYKIFND